MPVCFECANYIDIQGICRDCNRRAILDLYNRSTNDQREGLSNAAKREIERASVARDFEAIAAYELVANEFFAQEQNPPAFFAQEQVPLPGICLCGGEIIDGICSGSNTAVTDVSSTL